MRNPKIFLWAMILATCVPFFTGFALAPISFSESQKFDSLLLLLAGPLGAHQVSTLYFYFDKVSLPVITKNWAIYMLVPVLILGASFFLMYSFGQELKYYLLGFLSAWTIYHYQKQNVGVFALVSPLTNKTRMTVTEKRLIIWAGFGGIFAFGNPRGGPWFENTLFESFGGYAHALSLLILAGVFSGFVYCFWKASKRRVNKAVFSRDFFYRWLLLFIFVIFFVPIYLIDNPLLAFATFAFAHGLQYFLVMFFISIDGKLALVNRAAGFKKLSTILMSLLSVAFLIILTVLTWKGWQEIDVLSSRFELRPLGYGLMGLSVAFSFVHYYVDSKIWKMSNPEVRRMHMEKLDFIFK